MRALEIIELIENQGYKRLESSDDYCCCYYGIHYYKDISELHLSMWVQRDRIDITSKINKKYCTSIIIFTEDRSLEKILNKLAKAIKFIEGIE